jgi:hypothetical protein
LQLADRAVSLGKNHPKLVWFLHCKGPADYRRGNFRAAIEGLEPILPADEVGYPSLTTAIDLGLAMARYQQGEKKGARERLDQLGDRLRSPGTDRGRERRVQKVTAPDRVTHGRIAMSAYE